MIVDYGRGSGADCSRTVSAPEVASAIAAVGAAAAAAPPVSMHRVLSAPLLSPTGAASESSRPRREGRLSGGVEQHSQRLPSLRQVCQQNTVVQTLICSAPEKARGRRRRNICTITRC